MRAARLAPTRGKDLGSREGVAGVHTGGREGHVGYLAEAEQREILRRVRAGENSLSIAQAVGRPRRLVYVVLKRTGGFIPRARPRSPLRLSLAQRAAIWRGLRAGSSCRSIARGLHRAPSSVSREARRSGG